MIYDVIKKGLKLNMYVLMTLIFLGGIISTGWAYENPPETYTCDDTFEEYDFIEKNNSWTLIIEDGCDSPTIYGSDVHLVYNKSTTGEFVFERHAASLNSSGEMERLFSQDLPDNTHASTYFHYFDDVTIQAELFNGTGAGDSWSTLLSGIHHLNFENSNYINRIDIINFVETQHLILESLKSNEQSSFNDPDTDFTQLRNIFVGENDFDLFFEQGVERIHFYNEIYGFDNPINNSDITLNFSENTSGKSLEFSRKAGELPKIYNSNLNVFNDGEPFEIVEFMSSFPELINNNFYFENIEWNIMLDMPSQNIDNFYLNTFEFVDSEFDDLINENFAELQIYNNDTGIPIGNRYIVDGDDYYSCDTTTSSQTINNVNYISCDEGVSVGAEVEDYIITDSYSATPYPSSNDMENINIDSNSQAIINLSKYIENYDVLDRINVNFMDGGESRQLTVNLSKTQDSDLYSSDTLSVELEHYNPTTLTITSGNEKVDTNFDVEYESKYNDDSYIRTFNFQSDERTGQFIANVMSGIGIGLGNLMVSISTPALIIVWVIAIAGSIVTIVYTVTSLITRRGKK